MQETSTTNLPSGAETKSESESNGPKKPPQNSDAQEGIVDLTEVKALIRYVSRQGTLDPKAELVKPLAAAVEAAESVEGAMVGSLTIQTRSGSREW